MIQFLIVGLEPSGGDGGRELEGSREKDIFFARKRRMKVNIIYEVITYKKWLFNAWLNKGEPEGQVNIMNTFCPIQSTRTHFPVSNASFHEFDDLTRCHWSGRGSVNQAHGPLHVRVTLGVTAQEGGGQ